MAGDESTLDTLCAAVDGEPGAGPALLAPGDSLGRYTVLGRLGAGAMGVVLAAYDAKLDRKVALKLLHGREGEAARERLRREARALAKLDHPNVVAVHDVGEHGQQLFLAMEFVRGQTLREWLAGDVPRPWAEVLPVFIEAGRGLAAAHGEGMVHRDFKPDNVMIGEDGRVRVMDFGLARGLGPEQLEVGAEGERPEPDAMVESVRESQGSVSLSATLTRTGALVGTPAYMAPEQLAGETLDARSDQFGFCVALYEGLYGVRPFAGRSSAELYYNIRAGQTVAPPGPDPLPRGLRARIERGLRCDPAERFASMDDLLEALSVRPRESRGPWPAVLGAAAVLAVIVGIWQARDTNSGELGVLTCEQRLAKGGGDGEAGWAEPLGERLEARAQASSLLYADPTTATAREAFSAWERGWARARLEACEATFVDGWQSEPVYEGRVACLERQRLRVEAMAAGLSRDGGSSDELWFETLGTIPSAIPDPRGCDGAAVARERKPEGVEGAAVEALRQRLAAVLGVLATRNFELARTQSSALVAEARRLGFEPVLAEALHVAGLAEIQVAPKAGLATLREAAVQAQAVGDDLLFAEIALSMGRGVTAGDQRESELWVELAGASLARTESRAEARPKLLLNLEFARGTTASRAGRSKEALAAFERAHQRLAAGRLEGREWSDTGFALQMAHGELLVSLGRYDEAERMLERTVGEILERHGSSHPSLIGVHHALAKVHGGQGRHDEAQAIAREALSIAEAAHGPSHREVGVCLNTLGVVFLGAERYGEAIGPLTRARGILADQLGAEHSDVATLDNNLGAAFMHLGRYGEAVASYRAGLEGLEARLGPEHPSVAVARLNLGAVELEQGQVSGQRAYFEAALVDTEAAEVGLVEAVGREHPALFALAHNHAEILMGLGRLEQARAVAEAGLALGVALHGADSPALVGVLATLAQICVALGDMEAGREHAERAGALVSADSSALDRSSAEFAAAAHGHARAEGPAARRAAVERGRGALELLAEVEGERAAKALLGRWLTAHSGG